MALTVAQQEALQGLLPFPLIRFTSQQHRLIPSPKRGSKQMLYRFKGMGVILNFGLSKAERYQWYHLKRIRYSVNEEGVRICLLVHQLGGEELLQCLIEAVFKASAHRQRGAVHQGDLAASASGHKVQIHGIALVAAGKAVRQLLLDIVKLAVELAVFRGCVHNNLSTAGAYIHNITGVVDIGFAKTLEYQLIHTIHHAVLFFIILHHILVIVK